MPTNYIVTYLQGMFAEYLASIIAFDPNYIRPTFSYNLRTTNRFSYNDVIRHHYNSLKIITNASKDTIAIGHIHDDPPYYIPCNQAQIEGIEKDTQGGNNITLTHLYWPEQTHLINIPRHQKVFFYVNPDQVLFVFLMGVLKAVLCW